MNLNIALKDVATSIVNDICYKFAPRRIRGLECDGVFGVMRSVCLSCLSGRSERTFCDGEGEVGRHVRHVRQ